MISKSSLLVGGGVLLGVDFAGVLGGGFAVGWVFEDSVEVAGDVALEAAAGFSGGFAFAGALGDVGAGFGAVSGAGDGDGVDCLMLLWLSNRVLVGCEGGEPLVVLGGELMVVVDASFEL